jgi:serine/threonine-protein kinase
MAAGPSHEFLALQAALAGRFSLERELGRGGNGIVFLASDVALQRPVAIKLLPPAQADRADVRDRFLREARTAAHLSHPHIVPIHLVEQKDGLLFFVMGFVEGETLTQRVERAGPLAPEAAARLMQEMSWALGYAHGRGVVHRDVKPDNVMLERGSDRAVVMDFGIARRAATGTLSGPGELLGTVQFMSPEQAMGTDVDARSDLYSLGATIYYGLTGELTHEGPTIPAILMRLVSEPAPNVSDRVRGIPVALADAVNRCLRREAKDRFESGDALASTLAAAAPGRAPVPPEIRSFLRDQHVVGVIGFVTALIWFGVALMWTSGGLPRTFFPITSAIAAMVGLVCAGGLLGGMMNLVRAGYSWRETEGALAREAEDVAAEQRAARIWAARVSGGMRVGRAKRVGVTLFVATVAFYFVLGLRAYWRVPPAQRTQSDLLMVYFGLAYAVAGTVFLSPWGQRWSERLSAADPDKPLRIMKFTPLQLLRGRAGRMLFSIAERATRGVARLLGLGPAQRTAMAPSAATETLLLRRVDELVGALPEPVRERLAEAVGVATRLERAVAALRAREQRVSTFLAETPAGSPARRDFERARDEIQGAIARGNAALEELRLNLLKLNAGLVTAESITAELQSAREIGEAIDALLAGADSVRAMLKTPRS